MRYPAEGDDLPNGDMPPGSSGLMTFEDAADVSAVANSAPSICPRRHPGDRGVSRANRARTGAVPAMPEIAVLQSICAYRLIVSPTGGSGSPVLKIRNSVGSSPTGGTQQKLTSGCISELASRVFRRLLVAPDSSVTAVRLRQSCSTFGDNTPIRTILGILQTGVCRGRTHNAN